MRDSFLPFARPSLGEEEIREVVALGLWQLPRLDGFIRSARIWPPATTRRSRT